MQDWLLQQGLVGSLSNKDKQVIQMQSKHRQQELDKVHDLEL